MRNVKKMCRRNHLKLHHLCSLCVGNEDVYKLFIEIVFTRVPIFSQMATINTFLLNSLYILEIIEARITNF